MQATLPMACFLSMIRPPGIQFENSLLQIAPVHKAKCPYVRGHNDIEFRLYTRHNPTTYQELTIDDDEKLFASSIDFHDPTMIYFHAFMETPDEGSASAIREAYILRGDTNIIQVDASRLEAGPWYFTAAENTWYIGKFAARFIDFLVSRGLDLSKTHLVGHSLGAQAAGVAGASLESGRVSRITGLDPALPLFAGLPLEQRLDPSDAHFVDVIHTDAGIFGVHEPVGHTDFYPNGGISPQPGCELEVVIPQHLLLNKCEKTPQLRGFYTFYLAPIVNRTNTKLARNIMKLFAYLQTAKPEIKITKGFATTRVINATTKDNTETFNATDVNNHRINYEQDMTKKDISSTETHTELRNGVNVFKTVIASPANYNYNRDADSTEAKSDKSLHRENKEQETSGFTQETFGRSLGLSTDPIDQTKTKKPQENIRITKNKEYDTHVFPKANFEDQIMVESAPKQYKLPLNEYEDSNITVSFVQNLPRQFIEQRFRELRTHNQELSFAENSQQKDLKAQNLEGVFLDDPENKDMKRQDYNSAQSKEKDIQYWPVLLGIVKLEDSPIAIDSKFEQKKLQQDVPFEINEHTGERGTKESVPKMADPKPHFISEEEKEIPKSEVINFNDEEQYTKSNIKEDLNEQRDNIDNPTPEHLTTEQNYLTTELSTQKTKDFTSTEILKQEINENLPQEPLSNQENYATTPITQLLLKHFEQNRENFGATTKRTHTTKRQKRFISFFQKSESEQSDNFFFKMLEFLLKNRKNVVPVFTVMREINTLVKSANGELNHISKERNNYIGAPPVIQPVTYSLELGNENKAVVFIKKLLGLAPKGDRLTISGTGK